MSDIPDYFVKINDNILETENLNKLKELQSIFSEIFRVSKELNVDSAYYNNESNMESYLEKIKTLHEFIKNTEW